MIQPERLEVYRDSLELARTCAVACSSLPDASLRSQLLRAVRSIPANLAEGSAGDSQAVFARYVAIALGSTAEASCHVQIASDAGVLNSAAADALHQRLDSIRRRLIRLLIAVRRNSKRRSG